MICPFNKFNTQELIDKYPFLSSISIECVNKNKSHVYMDASVVLETTPHPDKFYDLKYDVYYLVKQKTNKTPIVRQGWNLSKKVLEVLN
jgi:hypothetical protein